MSVILIKWKHFKLWMSSFDRPVLTLFTSSPSPEYRFTTFFFPLQCKSQYLLKGRIQASSLSGVSFCPLVGGKIRIHSVSLRKCVSLWHAGPWGTVTGRIAQAGSCFQETQMRVLSVTFVVACNILFFLKTVLIQFWGSGWRLVVPLFEQLIEITSPATSLWNWYAPGVCAAALIAPEPDTRQLKTTPQSWNLWNYAKQPLHREPAKAG